jgi:cytoskeleton protein RodZ
VSLFQRITKPFGESPEDEASQPERAHAVGELLREQRRELGLDLETVGEALRIKPVYLIAIEQGRTADLPGATYAVGFIRAYAHYLGFDAERVLESYKAESGEVQVRPDLSLPVPLGERSMPGGRILLVGLILALCGYGTWYYLATGERSRPERVSAVPAELQQAIQASGIAPSSAANPAPAPPAAGAVAAAAPRFGSGVLPAPDAAGTAPNPGPAATSAAAPAAVPPSEAPAAAAAVTGEAAAAAGSQAANPTGSIEIRASADCWIQIRAADQTIVFSRVLKAGESYRVPRSGLSMRTGNAGALAILVDGKQAPSLGALGTLRRDVALEPQALLAGTAIRG